MAALSALLLVGCGVQTAPPPLLQALAPTNVHTRSSDVTVHNPIIGRVTMESGTVGWAVGEGAALPTTVLRTTDAGRTWVSVSPKGASGELIFDAAGAETAWAAMLSLVGAGHSVTVYRTVDGGKTWVHGRAIPVKYGDGGGFLAFAGQRGWLEVGEAGNANILAAQLFSTTDGGLNWTLVSQNPGGASAPLPGFGPIDVVRPTLGYTAPRVGLYASEDAGRTWKQVALGIDAAQAIIGLPTFSRNAGLMWIIPTGINSRLRFLRSTDGGGRWALTGSRFPATSAVDMMNGHDAVVVTPQGTTYRTANGGMSWNFIPADRMLHSRLGAYFVGAVDFISSRVGWMVLAPRGSTGGNLLLQTVDGGIYWQVLHP